MSEALGRGQHRRQVARVVGGRQEEQRADLLGRGLDAARVRALDEAGDRDRRIHGLLELAEPAQLGDRERQPLGPAEDLLHPARGGQAADQPRRQQARRLAVERLDRQLLEPRGVERRQRLVTRGQDHRDRRAGEPAAREQQRVKRRRVEPMHVVDAREHRPLGRREQQQAESGRSHEEAVALDGAPAGRAPRPAPSRCGPGQLAKAIQHRAQQLEHPGEGDLGLARDAARAQHREAFGALRGEVQQRRLARARDAPQHQRATAACSCRADQRLQARALRVPAQEHAASVPSCTSMWGWNVGSSWTRAGGARPYGRHVQRPYRPLPTWAQPDLQAMSVGDQ